MTEHQEIWCQPADQPKRQFIVMFDDPQMDLAVFTDETEARSFWEKANLNWTCYLMGTMPRSTELPKDNLRVTGFRGNPLRVVLSNGQEATVTQKLIDAFASPSPFEFRNKPEAPGEAPA